VAVEGEKGRGRIERTPVSSTLELLGDQRGDPGAVWHQPAFPELAATHDEETAVSVDVAEAQAAHFAGA
jgi:hypothetical protein